MPIPEHPRRVEVHQFTKQGRILLLTVDALLLCEINPLASDILALCDGRHRDEVVACLQANYPTQDILDTLEELQGAGILVEEIPHWQLQAPSWYPLKNIELHVCHDCNLRCVYCYGEGGSYHGPRTYMMETVAEAAIEFLIRESGRVRTCGITFFGGEPLMNFPLIQHIVTYARSRTESCSKQFRFSMTTNGVLLTDKIIEYLNEEDIGVMVSMDGPKSLHDRVRPHAQSGVSSYDVTVPGVQQLIKSRKGKVSARATITSYCLDVQSIIKHLLLLGFGNVYLCSVSAEESQPYALSSEEHTQLMAELCQVEQGFLDMAQRGLRQGGIHLRRELARFHRPSPTLYPCGFGRGMLAVSPEGDLYPCHRFVGIPDFRFGNVLEDWDNGLRQEVLARHVDTRTSCRHCWARHLCAGGCYQMNLMSTGDPFAPGGGMCRMTKRHFETLMSIYAEAAHSGLLERIFPESPPAQDYDGAAPTTQASYEKVSDDPAAVD